MFLLCIIYCLKIFYDFLNFICLFSYLKISLFIVLHLLLLLLNFKILSISESNFSSMGIYISFNYVNFYLKNSNKLFFIFFYLYSFFSIGFLSYNYSLKFYNYGDSILYISTSFCFYTDYYS
jgi:hypothetical protein